MWLYDMRITIDSFGGDHKQLSCSTVIFSIIYDKDLAQGFYSRLNFDAVAVNTYALAQVCSHSSHICVST